VDFAGLLLEKACVSLVPGRVFGEHGEGYLRLSFTAPLERLEEAMQRIAEVVRLNR
jgi:aspartate/methionine/tyrosine aminotransferase